MNSEKPNSEWAKLIKQSGLSTGTQSYYVAGWRKWEGFCEQTGLDPVHASWEDVIEFLRSCELTTGQVRSVRAGIAFVYRALGMASPAHDRRVMAEIYGLERYGFEESYGELTWARIVYAQDLYKAWCGRHGLTGSRESGEQVARFLSELAPEYGYGYVHLASVAVSRLLESEGYPTTADHPAVRAVTLELRHRGKDRTAVVGRDVHGGRAEHLERWPRQWEVWCVAEGIDPGDASPDDALRYLVGLEPQRDAARRVSVLSERYEGSSNPFADPAVVAWRKEYARKVRHGELPPVLRRRSMGEGLDVFGVVSDEEIEVPVGLTREEVQRVSNLGMGRVSTDTVWAYGDEWVKFRTWYEARGVPLDKLGVWHVLAYLEELADRKLRVATLRSTVNGLTFGFDQHRFDPNPANSERVTGYLRELDLERKEMAEQMDAIQLSDYATLVESAEEQRPHERSKQAVLRGATDVAMVGVSLDGLLRGKECARAAWKHINRMPDGSGSLLIPESKVDRFGKGDYAYISVPTMGRLDVLRDVKKGFGLAVGSEDSVFGLTVGAMGHRIRSACAYAGLEGRFGVRSCRIGMAQELAKAGFGLSMIMQAGRWTDAKMPWYYIRELKVQESAMAEMHRMLVEGRHDVFGEAKGYDIVSAFHAVKYGR